MFRVASFKNNCFDLKGQAGIVQTAIVPGETAKIPVQNRYCTFYSPPPTNWQICLHLKNTGMA